MKTVVHSHPRAMRTAILCLLGSLLLAIIPASAASRDGAGLQTLPLTFGTAIRGSLATPAEVDRFTFTASTGTRIWIDSLLSESTGGLYRLVDPNGVELLSSLTTTSDDGVRSLPSTGTYTLSVYGGPGSYDLRVIEVGTSPVVGYGTPVNGVLDEGRGVAIYRFQGKRGQVIHARTLLPVPQDFNWRLVSPSNGLLSYTSTASDHPVLQLGETGFYTVVMEGLSQTATGAAYGFQVDLLSDPVGTASGLGTIISERIGTGQSKNYPFYAPAGTFLYLDNLMDDVQGLLYTLKDPDGNPLWNATGNSDFGPQMLPKNGNYTFTVSVGADQPSAICNFRLLDLSTGLPEAHLGETLSIEAATPHMEHFWRMPLTAGTLMFFDGIKGNQGGTLGSLMLPGMWGGIGMWGTEYDNGPLRAPYDGEYLVVASNTRGYAAPLSFRVQNWDAAPVLSLGVDYVGTKNPGALNMLSKVPLLASQRLVIRGSSSGSLAALTIYHPNTSALLYLPLPEGPSGYWEFRPPVNGTYLISLNGEATPNPVDYRFRLDAAVTTEANLAFGQNVSGQITKAGQIDRYLFQGNAADRIVLDSLAVDNTYLLVRLYAPSGTLILSTGDESDANPIVLTETGQYRLEVGGDRPDTGGYAFRLLRTSDATTTRISLGQTVQGAIDTSTLQNNAYVFDVGANQPLFLDVLNAEPAYCQLWTATASLLYNGPLADFYTTSREAGQYLLMVFTPYGNLPSYTFRVINTTGSNKSLVLGSLQAGSITGAGLEKRYTFEGHAGQRLYYSGAQGATVDLDMRLVSPSDNWVFIGSSKANYGSVQLTESGIYTLVIGGMTDRTGDYAFRLLDIASIPEISTGSAVSGTINPGTAQALYRLRAIRGQRLALTMSSVDNSSGTWYLEGSSGGYLSSASIINSMGPVDIMEDGDLVVILNGAPDAVAPINFQFLAQDVSDPSGGTTGLDREFDGILNGVTPDEFTFTASAGDYLFLNSLDRDYDTATWSILDSSMNLLWTYNASYDYAPLVIPKTDTYTLRVNGNAGDDYRFQILNMDTDSDLLVPGATVSGTVTRPYEVKIYRWDEPALSRVYYDSLMTDQNAPLGVSIYSGGWITCYDCISAGRDSGPYRTLNGTKTYFFVTSNTGDPTPYSFRLLDLDASSQQIAVGDQVGGALQPVPANRLSVVGSYVDSSLRNYSPVDDWRQTQTIAGMRNDPVIDFESDGWGDRAAVGLTPGDNDNWDNFSVQWDGQVTIAKPGTRLYLMSDDASRLLVDVNKDHVLEPGGSEFVDNGWGVGQSTLYSGGSPALDAGTYDLRVQYQEDSGQNRAVLLEDTGLSLPAFTTVIYRFQAQAGRFFLHSLNPAASGAAWYLYAENLAMLGSNGFPGDFEVATPRPGTFYLVVANPTASHFPIGFSLRQGLTTSTTLALGTTYSGTLAGGGDEAQFTFTAHAGQRIFYDALQNLYAPVSMTLTSPLGYSVWANNQDYDGGPLALSENGQYQVSIHNNTAIPSTYKFRVLDLDNAPWLSIDTDIPATVAPELGAKFYRFQMPANMGMAIETKNVDGATGTAYVYNEINNYVTGFGIGGGQTGFTVASTNVQLLGLLGQAPGTYTLRASVANHAPTIAPALQVSVNEETPLSYTIPATDLEQPNDVLTFSLEGAVPPGLTLDSTTGVVTWTPTEAQGKGTYPVTVRVKDDGVPSLESVSTLTIVVNEVNKAPSIDPIPDRPLDELTPLTFIVRGLDSDSPANALTFSLSADAPAGATITPQGEFSWTPSEAQGPGTYTITLKLTDSNPDAVNDKSLVTTRSFKLAVREVNTAPILAAINDATVDELVAMNLATSVTDSDIPANTFTYALEVAPTGATIDAAGVIHWTPTEQQGPGTFDFRVKVTDSGSPALSDTKAFKVTVREVNTAPVLAAINNTTVDELAAMNLATSVTDSDIPANTFSYALEVAPAGATIDAAGVIHWTPTEQQGPGTFDFRVKATDSGSPALSDTKAFKVTVREVNTAPTIEASIVRTIHAGQSLSITPAASDNDVPANTLSFSLAPAALSGMSLGASSGTFTWTPTDAQTGDYSYRIVVSDNGSPTLSATCNLRVVVAVRPSITIQVAATSSTVTWTSLPGSGYQLEGADALDGVWKPIGGVLTAAAGTASQTDASLSSTSRFYRVRVLPAQ